MSLILKGIMTKRFFIKKCLRTKIPLELVHSNLYGPINVNVQGRYEYFINFVDDYSSFGHIYLLHHKSDSLEKFREYKTDVEIQLGKIVKRHFD